MRGVFTAGVLDVFLRRGLLFNYVAGTSAGTSNGLSYASRQAGRAHYCNIDILKKRSYIGWRFIFTQRCVMDYDFLYGELPKKVYPFDFAQYLKSGRFILTATDCETGEAAYFDTPQNLDDLLAACRASCSMPVFCPIVRIGGRAYLDGGVCDPVPVKKAAADGFEKRVVVLTRPKGYRKNENWNWASWIYFKYPRLRKALAEKSDRYNAVMDWIDAAEKSGEILAIRPTAELPGRLESDSERLENLYQNGVGEAEKILDKIEKYIG